MRDWLAGVFGSRVLRALGSTWRVSILHEDVLRAHVGPSGRPAVFTFFHGRMLVPAFVFRRQNIAILISQHGDGELITAIVRRLGFVALRGSTSRGGVRALLEMSDLPADTTLAITPDGPRGPAESIQPGAVWIASHTGRRLIPVGIGASRAWRAPSWDRFMIPLPFTHVAFAFGEPIDVPGDMTDERIPEFAAELQRRMLDLERECATHLAGRPSTGRVPAAETDRP